MSNKHVEEQDGCDHGRTGKDCRPDPSPNGKDCEVHGQHGGINEDHCLSTTTSTTTERPTTTTTSGPGASPTTTSSTLSTAPTSSSATTTSTTASPSFSTPETTTTSVEIPVPLAELPHTGGGDHLMSLGLFLVIGGIWLRRLGR